MRPPVSKAAGLPATLRRHDLQLRGHALPFPCDRDPSSGSDLYAHQFSKHEMAACVLDLSPRHVEPVAVLLLQPCLPCARAPSMVVVSWLCATACWQPPNVCSKVGALPRSSMTTLAVGVVLRVGLPAQTSSSTWATYADSRGALVIALPRPARPFSGL